MFAGTVGKASFSVPIVRIPSYHLDHSCRDAFDDEMVILSERDLRTTLTLVREPGEVVIQK